MEQYHLVEKERMMSSSDENTDKTKSISGWQPLIPEQLEHCDSGTGSIEDRKDPAMERSFIALYEQHIHEKRHFSLLYASDEDETASDEGEHSETDSETEENESTEEAHGVEVSELPDVEAIEKKAYEAGFAKGEAEGYDAGLLTANEKTERLSLIVNELETFWANLVKKGESRIIELVAKVAEKVVYGQVSVDNEIITRAILDVFEKIPDPVDATITVHPLDYEYIEVVKDDLFEKIRGLTQVRILSDQLIEPGGCRIETKAGEVDTSIEERLEAVKKSILGISERL